VFWGQWTDRREEMVAAILNAARCGGDQAIAAPRGEGNTSIVQCVTIYCVMHGINGKRTFLKWAQDYIVLPTVRVPDHWDQRLRPGQPSLGSGAVITTRGLDSAIRGVLVGTKRPDLVIIDDPESARLGPQRRPDGPRRNARSGRTRQDVLNRRQQRKRRQKTAACHPRSLDSSQIGSGKNQPRYSVAQPENVKVDDQ
jgi:hypothetical protein